MEHIADFQVQFPGCWFKSTLLEQHGQSLASWTQMDRDGNALVPGQSYARYAADGRIEFLAGFWNQPAA